jgi:hypothetical protein
MKTKPSFSEDLLSLLKNSKTVRVRAGTGGHRFIGIWFVVVNERVFARSWSVKSESWYRTFLKEPRGAMQVGKAEIVINAAPARNGRVRDAVDRAYREKYKSDGEKKYVKDLCGEISRATTIEFMPASETGSHL